VIAAVGTRAARSVDPDFLEALYHLTAAEETAGAARLAVKEGRGILSRGRSEELLRVLERLLVTVEEPAHAAELRLLKAHALNVRGELDDAAAVQERAVARLVAMQVSEQLHLESLAEDGVKMGLPRDVATLLAAQTTLGAAKQVLDTGAHPALLKDEVTTPAGCTIDGLLELEEGKLRVTLIKAVVEATRRAAQLISS